MEEILDLVLAQFQVCVEKKREKNVEISLI